MPHTVNATAKGRNQTQKGTNPVPVHLQETHRRGIPAEAEQIQKGLGARDRE